MDSKTYHPDFDSECRICGSSPCVIVAGHIQPYTELCGVCFWHDQDKLECDTWNDEEEEDDET